MHEVQSMNSVEIISKINTYLYKAAISLAEWLDNILPRVSDSWWQDCVLSSLSFTQKEIATTNNFVKLSDFDLSALLRIADKSWYDMLSITYMPTKERNCIREMVNVRNNWAHCSAELPDKDTIIHDLTTIIEFLRQINGSESVCTEIYEFIDYIEQPDSIKQVQNIQQEVKTGNVVNVNNLSKSEIEEKSLVYLVGSPEKEE